MIGSIPVAEAIDRFPNLIWSSNADGERIYVNQTWSQFTGRNIEQESGYNWLNKIHISNRAKVFVHHLSALFHKEDYSIEYQLLDGQGNYRWVIESGRPYVDESGHLIGFIGSCIDNHARKIKQLKKEHERHHDLMTGLYNYAFFHEYMTKQFERRCISKQFAVFYLDINGLKTINDTYGHEFGNKLIIAASEVLKSTFRPEDILARIGGDEFTVLLNLDGEHADNFTEIIEQRISDLHANIKKSNQVNSDQRLNLQIAIGYSIYSGQSFNEMCKEADKRMDQNKKSQNATDNN